MLPTNVIECHSMDIFYLLSLCFIVAIAVKLILIALLHFPLLKYTLFRTSLVVQWIRFCLPVQETWVRSLSQEDPPEKEMATHSSTLAWEIPWTEELGGLDFMGLQRVRLGWVTIQNQGGSVNFGNDFGSGLCFCGLRIGLQRKNLVGVYPTQEGQ